MLSAKTISRNFSFQAGGKILSVLIGLVAVAILTRALGPEQFGEYTTATTFLHLFGVVVDFGLTLTLVVMISETGANEEKIAGNLLGLRLVSGALFYSLAPIAVLAFPWSHTVSLGVLVGAIAFFFMSAAGMLIGIFQKHAVMWRSALAEVITRIVLVATIALFAFWHLGTVAMIAAMIVSNVLWFALTIWFARPLVRLRPQADWETWKRILSRSWPIGLSIIFNLLYLKGDILFLATFRDATEVGYYGAAYKFIDVLTALPVMFMGLILPSLASAWTANNKDAFARQLSRTFDLFMLGAIPVVAGTQLIAQPLVTLVAGPGYEPAAAVLKPLVIAILGVFAGAIYGHTIVAINKQKTMITGYAAVAVLTIIGYLIFIPAYGMYGAAWMTVFSESLIALLTFAVVRGRTQTAPSLTVSFKAMLASIVMYIVLVLIPSLPVLLMIAIGALVYLLVLLGIGGIKKAELTSLFSRSS